MPGSTGRIMQVATVYCQEVSPSFAGRIALVVAHRAVAMKMAHEAHKPKSHDNYLKNRTSDPKALQESLTGEPPKPY